MNNYVNNYEALSVIGATLVRFNDNVSLTDVPKNRFFVSVLVGMFNKYIYIPVSYEKINEDSTVTLTINDKLLRTSSDTSYVELLHACMNDLSILRTGTPACVLGRDYYISKSLYNYFKNDLNNPPELEIKWPNVMQRSSGAFNDEWFDTIYPFVDGLSMSGRNKFYGHIEMHQNVEYAHYQNVLSYNEYDEDDIKNFRYIFAKTILDGADYTLIDFIGNTYNPIYRQVLKFWANEDIYGDSVYSSLTALFGTSYKPVIATTSGCGCNKATKTTMDATYQNTTTNADGTISFSQSCADTYMKAIYEWTTNMFGNPDFYCEWFYRTDEDNNLLGPNVPMIDTLIKLLNTLLDSDYNLSLSDTLFNHCTCPDDYEMDDAYCSNRAILTAYRDDLKKLREGKLSQVSNSIHIHGSQFGEIFPKLYF